MTRMDTNGASSPPAPSSRDGKAVTIDISGSNRGLGWNRIAERERCYPNRNFEALEARIYSRARLWPDSSPAIDRAEIRVGAYVASDPFMASSLSSYVNVMTQVALGFTDIGGHRVEVTQRSCSPHEYLRDIIWAERVQRLTQKWKSIQIARLKKRKFEVLKRQRHAKGQSDFVIK